MCVSQDYVLNKEATDYVAEHLRDLAENHEEHFANAREVRNYFERCIERQATRVVSEPNIDANSLTTFKLPDVIEDQQEVLLYKMADDALYTVKHTSEKSSYLMYNEIETFKKDKDI